MSSIHMRTAFLAIVLLLLSGGRLRAQLAVEECSDTEAWIPVGAGLPGRADVAAEMDGKLYAVHSVLNEGYQTDSMFALVRLDGTTWTTLSTFTVSPNIAYRPPIGSLIAYKGELYIGGCFLWLNHLNNTSGLAKWDGSAWKAVPGIKMLNGEGAQHTGIGSVGRMTIYMGELIVAGTFGDSLRVADWGIAAYDGSTWHMIGKATEPGDTVYVETFAEWRGNLYAGGRIGDINGVRTRYGVVRWNDSSWSALPDDATYATITKLVAYNDRLYMFRNGANQTVVKRWDRTSWEDLPQLIGPGPIRNWTGAYPGSLPVTVYKGELYMILQKFFFDLDAGGVIRRIAYRWDGSVSRPIANVDALANLLIVHDGQLFAGGEFTHSCSMETKHIARLCDAADCGGIAGTVVEAAGNCDSLRDQHGIAGNMVELLPGPKHAMTDDAGNYRLMVTPGAYTVSATPPRYFRQTCPEGGAGRNAIVAAPGGTVSGLNFAFAAIPNIRDMDISMAATRPRAGTRMRFTLVCVNRGPEDVDRCRVRLHVEPPLAFDRADPAESMRYPSTIEWTLDGIRRGERRTIEAYFTVPASTPFNTLICTHADVDVENIGRDGHPEWNFDSLCTRTLNSYDPNDIAVAPGVGDQGLISSRDSVLTYTIRFENTGNDTAYKVIVIDTLSPHLDVSSLMLGAASHPFRLKFGESGALIWMFDGVNLPASTVNPGESQGYLKYSVRLRRGLQPNTEITNRASIYFDYNQPVVTNTVRSTTASPTSVPASPAESDGVTVYPNPTFGRLDLRGAELNGGVIRVENLLGRTMLVQRVGAGDGATIDLAGLPAGVYVVAVETAGGRRIARPVTVLR